MCVKRLPGGDWCHWDGRTHYFEEGGGFGELSELPVEGL